MEYILEPYYDKELESAIEESPDGTTIAICTCKFLKELDFSSPTIEYEELAFLVEVRDYNEYSFAIRPNRNTFRDHEFDKYEEHKWRIEPKSKLVLYNPFKSFAHLMAMSIGHTINIDTGEIHEPEYTWSYKKH